MSGESLKSSPRRIFCRCYSKQACPEFLLRKKHFLQCRNVLALSFRYSNIWKACICWAMTQFTALREPFHWAGLKGLPCRPLASALIDIPACYVKQAFHELESQRNFVTGQEMHALAREGCRYRSFNGRHGSQDQQVCLLMFSRSRWG